MAPQQVVVDVVVRSIRFDLTPSQEPPALPTAEQIARAMVQVDGTGGGMFVPEHYAGYSVKLLKALREQARGITTQAGHPAKDQCPIVLRPPRGGSERCLRAAGHSGLHRGFEGRSWL